jgi:aryl-alcohol dehydrogenase-like predicted oxidoreductase
VGVITYSSLASGFLSGKYRADQALPPSARATGVKKNYMNERGFAVLEAVEEAAKGVGATPAQVALAWIAHRPGITAPIASATSVDQLREILAALDLQLDAETSARLDRASAWREA